MEEHIYRVKSYDIADWQNKWEWTFQARSDGIIYQNEVMKYAKHNNVCWYIYKSIIEATQELWKWN